MKRWKGEELWCSGCRLAAASGRGRTGCTSCQCYNESKPCIDPADLYGLIDWYVRNKFICAMF